MNKSRYRKMSDDYYIEVEGVGMCIKTQAKGLLITAHPSAEAALTKVLGAPTGRPSPDTLDYVEWRISKCQ